VACGGRRDRRSIRRNTHDACGAFGHAFDQPYSRDGRPEQSRQEDRRTGTIISELISVKKLTSPAASTLRGRAAN